MSTQASSFILHTGGEAEPDRAVRGRCALPPGRDRVAWVLVAPGYTASIAHTFYPALMTRCVAAGLGCVQIAFSGTGLSEDLESVAHPELAARATYGWELEDLDAVWRFVAAGGLGERLDQNRAGLLGHSRGGGMAVVHAAEHPGRYRGVALWNAIHAILRHTPERIEEWRSTGTIDVMHWTLRRRIPLQRAVLDDAERHRARYDIEAAGVRLDAPALVVQAAEDTAVTPAHGRRLASATGAAFHLVEGTDHTFGMFGRRPAPGAAFEDAARTTLSWLVERL